MSIETFARACSLLSKMPSPVPWSEGQAELYGIGLNALPDHVVTDTVARAIATCDERPTVAALIRMANELMHGPRPAADTAWLEIETTLSTRGLYCRPDILKPNIYREGEPRFSHRLISHTVRQMGGWRALCTWDMGLDTLKERFISLYRELGERSAYEFLEPQMVEPLEETPRILRLASGGG